ncbi:MULTISPECIES: DUF742 domain-containing protein [Streptomyces]|uniref:DUF742 domain-containing protein n=1 Tax=Streptomyces TaxID=1883 RepID=UPI0036A78405
MTGGTDSAYARPTGTGAMPEEFPIGPRPYAVTRGRTQPSFHLGVELLVIALVPLSPGPVDRPAAHLSPEHRTVLGLCRGPLSVAEIAAHSGLPLGVARILIADLVEGGLAHVNAPHDGPDGQPDKRLLERVLGGLRSL